MQLLYVATPLLGIEVQHNLLDGSIEACGLKSNTFKNKNTKRLK